MRALTRRRARFVPTPPTMRLIFFIVALAASPSLGSSPDLAVYVDGTLQPQAREALSKDPDFREGRLAGWRLFGALLPREARENVGVIEVVGSTGAKLRLEDPEHAYAGLEPVVLRDAGGGLRFRMMVAGPGSRAGRGSADTPRLAGAPRSPDAPRPAGKLPPARPAVPGNPKARSDATRAARVGIEDIVEIRVAHGRPPGAAAAASEPASFDLVVGGKTDRIGIAVLQGLGAAEHPPGAQGDAWSLRTLLGKKNAGGARAVVVRGRGDATTRITAADFGTTYLRLNRRGLFKLEQLDPGGQRRANVPDLKRIDVELE